MIRDDLERAIRVALQRVGANDSSFAIDYPPAETGADYSTNAALAAAKVLGKPPREVAELLVAELKSQNIPHVDKIEIAGAGFINFFLDPEYFSGIIEQAQDEKWGSGEQEKGTTIMVEYTQPNPFKPFHIGHLMSNALGESIARSLECEGAAVIRANYQGDVGLHVAKTLWAVMLRQFDPKDVVQLGEAYVIGNAAYEDDPAARTEIIAINKKIYEKDPALYPMYLEGRDASLKHFEMLYTILGTKFDEYFFESEVWPQGAVLVREGLESKIFEKSNGAVVFHGEAAGLHTRVFLTSEGLPTYEAKDLGLALAKLDRHSFDCSITTTAVEQNEYFKVVFEALTRLRPETRGKFVHVSHGMMILSSGKMSSRKGNVVTGELLIEGMIAAARERMKKREMDDVQKEIVARQIAIAAIKYSVLRQNAGKNIVFDPEQSLSLEGDSGPYIQYAHTRCVSILRKASAEGIEPQQKGVTLGALSEGHSLLLQILSRFPEIVLRASSEYEPHYIAQYLTELAGEFNSFYAREKVLDGSDAATAKLALVDAIRQTLKNGLWLLGIEAPEEM